MPAYYQVYQASSKNHFQCVAIVGGFAYLGEARETPDLAEFSAALAALKIQRAILLPPAGQQGGAWLAQDSLPQTSLQNFLFSDEIDLRPAVATSAYCYPLPIPTKPSVTTSATPPISHINPTIVLSNFCQLCNIALPVYSVKAVGERLFQAEVKVDSFACLGKATLTPDFAKSSAALVALEILRPIPIPPVGQQGGTGLAQGSLSQTGF
jgi:hypothetical protein